MYSEFVHELEDESGMRVDLRDQGTILISWDGEFPEAAQRISSEKLQTLEPGLAVAGRGRPAPHKPFWANGQRPRTNNQRSRFSL
jgi:hypothetical protein